MKNWPVFRLVAFDHCRVHTPWCVVGSGTAPVHRARRIAHALAESHLPPGGSMERVLASLVYLATAFRQSIIVWREQGRGVRERYGVGHLRQIRDLLELAWRANLPPRVYYFQRLFRHRDPAVRLAVIDHRELQLLLRAVHDGIDWTMLDDKVVFHAFCARHGLPTVPIVATYEKVNPAPSDAPSATWQMSLFSKPTNSYSSQGVASWGYDAASGLYRTGQDTFDHAGLEAWFAAQCRERTIIVQPRILNAPEIAPFAGHALTNCRMVTARRSDGTLFVLLAVLRMAVGDAITSDDPDYTFCAAVDLASGKLQPAESKRADHGTFSHHPDSGAPIAGVCPAAVAGNVRAGPARPCRTPRRSCSWVGM